MVAVPSRLYTAMKDIPCWKNLRLSLYNLSFAQRRRREWNGGPDRERPEPRPEDKLNKQYHGMYDIRNVCCIKILLSAYSYF